MAPMPFYLLHFQGSKAFIPFYDERISTRLFILFLFARVCFHFIVFPLNPETRATRPTSSHTRSRDTSCGLAPWFRRLRRAHGSSFNGPTPAIHTQSSLFPLSPLRHLILAHEPGDHENHVTYRKQSYHEK